VPEARGDEILAIGRYYLDQKENMAEVAFIVHDKWQNKGIGTMLLEKLTAIAKRNAISGFTAEVIKDNRRMQHVLNKCDAQITTTREENVISYKLRFK
jgi:RimJ/RimL family protein N-acetyltransferase